jgi:anti-sigma regulatory factor (Ser/Thr protein kinase)
MTCEQTTPSQAVWPLQSILTLGVLPTATPCARLHARNVACEWGLGGLADAVELVASELVTNAVRASTFPDGQPRYEDGAGLPYVQLRLSSDQIQVLIEVWDPNPRLPVPTKADADDESGRGLMLVEALCERWNWNADGCGGKVVWGLVSTA